MKTLEPLYYHKTNIVSNYSCRYQESIQPPLPQEEEERHSPTAKANLFPAHHLHTENSTLTTQ